MPLFTSAAQKAEIAQRAAMIHGQEGWPTPSFNPRLAQYSPFFNTTGSKEFPISGTVNGRVWATCRVASSFSSVGGNARRTTTYHHTAAVLPNTGLGLPYFDVFSLAAGWEQLQNIDKLRMNCGDAQFHQYFGIAANAPDQPRVYQFLTPQVKAGLYDVLRANRTARLRFGTREGKMFCWVNGKDARDANFPPLLLALANLAGIIDAQLGVAPAQATGPMQGQPMYPQQPYNPYQGR